MRYPTGILLAGMMMSFNSPAADEFFTPEEDRAGLQSRTEADKDLPNVLIIGDSISIGYTPGVAERLEGTANVSRPPANCGDTRLGLRMIERWLGDTRWDIIHFNWGLHDLCYRHPDARVYGNRDKVNGTISVTPEQYALNLEALVRRLKETGATLIWASTTVVPEGEAGRFVGDELKYNAIADEIMKRHGIAINDLHALSSGFPASMFVRPGDVHFTRVGSAKLAEQVAEAVRSALNL